MKQVNTQKNGIQMKLTQKVGLHALKLEGYL